MIKISFTAILLSLLCGHAIAQWETGQIYYGQSDWISYQVGNLPLVLLAPHGGDMRPNQIKDRSCTGCSTIQDYRTLQLTQEIAAHIHELTGCYPHVVINHLHRIKLDANRDQQEATDGDSLSTIAWQEWINFIDTAKTIVASQWGKGLVLDMHGHGHEIDRIELGYLLSGSRLRQSDSIIDTDYSQTNSIRRLVEDNPKGLSLSELIRGRYALGSIFENMDLPSVPSMDDPFPKSGEAYFSGGFNTARNGSRSGGPIDAIQLECHRSIRNDGSREQSSMDIASSALEYLYLHYFPDTSFSCLPLNLDYQINSLIKLHPNPFQRELNIEYPGQKFNIAVADVNGKVIYKAKSIDGILRISTENWLQGIYVILLSNKDIRVQKTVIKIE